MDKRSMGFVLILLFFTLFSFLSPTYGYDVLDPNGNITVKWDEILDDGDSQFVRISIYNYQLFRHIEHPGWKLGWTWLDDEVIWTMRGAEATKQGNCSLLKGKQLPHCCEKEPVIIDLLPGAPYNQQAKNCCKGGVLSSITQDPQNYLASFEMSIGGLSYNASNARMPENFTLGLPGYTCGPAMQVNPSQFFEDNGRRKTQALATWNVTCSYSQFLASPIPKCCVSFSSFYDETIVPCPTCSCGCQEEPRTTCVKPGELPPVLQLPQHEKPQQIVQCTKNMCPIKVHWHVKVSYTQYWRVKITIENQNFVQNYSQWNLVVLHPNLNNVTRVFSFNYKPLNQYGNLNDSGVFYGIQYYNDVLLQSGKNGNVQTEMLLNKDPTHFTFGEGWAFPRRISFNGDECVMPQPDDYPRLPNTAKSNAPTTFCMLLLFFLLFCVMF